MTSLQLLVVLSLFAGLARSQNVGDPCTPRWGADRCGEANLLTSNETACDDQNPCDNVEGPNVCSVINMYEQQTLTYTTKRECWRSFRRQRCYTYCAPNQCNGDMVNFTRTKLSCCDGFAQAETTKTEHAKNRYWGHRHRSRSLSRDGCPVELVSDVLSCLGITELSDFLVEIVQAPDLSARLSDPSSDPVTLFAVTNDALAGLSDEDRNALFGELTRISSLGAFIGDGRVKLFQGNFVPTLTANVSLHIDSTRNQSVKSFYVNGVRITQVNACQARNGVVHIIENVLPFSSATINDTLEELSFSFSTFNQLLDAAGISKFLAVPEKSRTLFAPTNDAFDDVPGLAECLLTEDNSHDLECFVLAHIVFGAHYSSTLEQKRVYGSFHGLLTIRNNTLSVVHKKSYYRRSQRPTDQEIEFVELDIPASNGVIHSIAAVIQPFSSEKLNKICPGLTTIAPSTSGPIVVGPEDPGTPGPFIPQ